MTFIDFILKEFYRVYNISIIFIDFILKDFYEAYKFVNDSLVSSTVQILYFSPPLSLILSFFLVYISHYNVTILYMQYVTNKYNICDSEIDRDGTGMLES